MSDATPTKILLVEDEEMNRDVLVRRLRRRGFEVVVAVDGQQGVAMAEAESPDLILMDMRMPILDGWDATRQIKSRATTRHIPVVGLSAYAMQGDRDAALLAGCDEYDTKPVDLKRLLSIIQELVG